MRRFKLDSIASTIVVEARSSVGPIAWEGRFPTGEFEVAVEDGQIVKPDDAIGQLDFDLRYLTSGNIVQDAELQRRMDVRRHPTAHVELVTATAAADGIFELSGTLSLHGRTRDLQGRVEVSFEGMDRLLVRGTQQIDIRDFGIPVPNLLMLQIYPDVNVSMVLVGSTAPLPATKDAG